MPETGARVRRDVVSFVRRGDRMNPSQQRALDRLSGRYVIEVPCGERRTSIAPDAGVDWAAAFGREAPLCVEIGVGSGEALTALATAYPEANVVGFEVFLPTAASALSRLERAGVENARLVIADGQQGVEALFAPHTITELWTFFPDPWHKKRHYKRRLVNPGFARIVAERLLPGGRWRLATDWEDYAVWMREVLDATPGLRNEYGDWAPRFAARPVTKFEQRGIDAGRPIWDLCYVARGTLGADQT